MTVNLRELLPTTFYALERLCSVNEKIAEVYGCISLEQAASLYFLLMSIKDDEDVFPAGKWATIHRLNDLCIKAAEERLK